MNGILIAIEGIDGAGKSTQIEMLTRFLREAGEEVVVSREPTTGEWGRKIRESALTGRMSLEDELHAFVEDRKQHVANLIQPSLDAGKIVILDRYFYSTIAYQGARGADVEELIRINHAIAPIPDVVLLVDIDPTVSVDRITGSRGDEPDEFEGVEYLAKVRAIFNQLAETHPPIEKLDGAQSVEEMRDSIQKHLINGVLADKRSSKVFRATQT